jgi:subtilisin-like proprotein convertase family protein
MNMTTGTRLTGMVAFVLLAVAVGLRGSSAADRAPEAKAAAHRRIGHVPSRSTGPVAAPDERVRLAPRAAGDKLPFEASGTRKTPAGTANLEPTLLAKSDWWSGGSDQTQPESGLRAGQPCGPLSFTQSSDPDTVAPATSVSCSQGVVTRANHYARCYDMAAEVGAGTEVRINCVKFGALNTLTPYNVTVTLYTSPSCPPSLAQLTQLASISVPVPVGVGVVTAPFEQVLGPVTVPPNTFLVVDIFSPDRTLAAGGDGGTFYMGTNSVGQSAPSYILAPDCAVNDYTSLGALGFPDTHIVEAVFYTQDDLPFGACCSEGQQTCQENIRADECLGDFDRFSAETDCAGFSPPCGALLNDHPCLARELACGATVVADNTNAGFDPDLELTLDPSLAFGGSITPRNTLWYRFVATATSAQVRTCATPDSPDAAEDTVVSIFTPRLGFCPFGECTTDAECEPFTPCLALCDPAVPGSVCAGETATGCCDACRNLTEIATSSAECGAHGTHGSACTLNTVSLEIGRTYYVLVGSSPGTRPGHITLELLCPCGDGPAGACCLGQSNCVDIPPGSFGALDCASSLGTWQGDGTMCDSVGDACSDVADHCNQPLTMACGESQTIDSTYFSTASGDPLISCRGFGAAPGFGTFWITFEATAESATIHTLESDFPVDDTLITLYDVADPCAAQTFNELGCNDDATGVGPTTRSSLCVRQLEIGRTYTVQVSAWAPSSRGPTVVSLECPGECGCAAIACPDGAANEAEACGDLTNGGCTAQGGAVFETIQCGQTICGTATAEIETASGTVRDLDWYKFTLDETARVTWSMDSQFSGGTDFLSISDCQTNQTGEYINVLPIGQRLQTRCNEPGSKSEVLPPGTWYVRVWPDFDTPACGDLNTYVASLSCEPVLAGCCSAAGGGAGSTCTLVSQGACGDLGGLWLGLDPAGQPITCDDSPCATGACCGEQGTCLQVDSAAACQAGVQGFVCNVTTNELPACGGPCGTTCWGDADGNGFVNPGDRGFISAAIGLTDPAILCQYDMDGNGQVNAGDRGFVSAHVGLCPPLPDYQNGSGLNQGLPDPRFDSGTGGILPGATWRGFGSSCEACPCVLPECAAGTPEGEAQCAADFVDTTNGGCNADTFVAGAVSCGETICGSGGWFNRSQILCTTDADCPGFEVGRCDGGFCAGGPFVGADADWYRIDLSAESQRLELTWTVDAAFPVATFIVSEPVDCSAAVTRSTGGCEPTQYTACLDPGVHYLVILPSGFDGVIGCDRAYTATLSCGPCRTIDELTATGRIVVELFSGDLQGVHDVPLVAPTGEANNMRMRRERPPYQSGQVLDAELLALDFSGQVGTPAQLLSIRERPDVHSTGLVNVATVDAAGSLTGGENFFDVFLDVSIPGSGLDYTTGPAAVRTTNAAMTSLPAYGQTYTGPVGGAVDLLRAVCVDEQSLEAAVDTAIPDNEPAGYSSTITVVDFGAVSDVDISVEVQHTFVADLTITIEHLGLRSDLWLRQCGGTDDLNLRFDDEGRGNLACNQLQTGPRLKTAAELLGAGNDLSVFDGLDRHGDWTITVADHSPGDTGTLVGWSLHFCDEFGTEVVGRITTFEHTVLSEAPGACCVDLTCVDTAFDTENECRAIGGTFYPGQSCAGVFSCPAACVNNGNDCGEACSILDGVTPYTTFGADSDGPQHPGTPCEYQGDGGLVHNDIWRTYVAPCTGTLVVELCNDIANTPGYTDCDSRVAIYDGNEGNCGDLWPFLLVCNDDGPGCFGYSSLAQAPVVAGQEYLIRLGGFGDWVHCNGEVAVTCVPEPLGACCDAEQCLYTVTEPDCSFTWFEGERCDDIAGPGNGYGCENPAGACCDGTSCTDSVFSSCDDDFYEGESCATFSCPTGDCCTGHGTPGCEIPTIEACVCAVDAFCCQFSWDNACAQNVDALGCGTCPDPGPPGNDHCATAACIAEGAPVTIDTSGATTTPPSSCATLDVFDVWYAYTPTVSGTITADTCGTPDNLADTTLTVWNACGGAEISCNDDTSACTGSFSLKSRVQWSGVAGTQYFIRLASPFFSTGTYTLAVTGGAGSCP